MRTSNNNSIVFRYDTIERNGREIPRTRCIISTRDGDHDRILTASTIHLYKGDTYNKVLARRVAFERAMQSVQTNNSLDKENRRDCWNTFFSRCKQPIGMEVNIDVPPTETIVKTSNGEEVTEEITA